MKTKYLTLLVQGEFSISLKCNKMRADKSASGTKRVKELSGEI